MSKATEIYQKERAAVRAEVKAIETLKDTIARMYAFRELSYKMLISALKSGSCSQIYSATGEIKAYNNALIALGEMVGDSWTLTAGYLLPSDIEYEAIVTRKEKAK